MVQLRQQRIKWYQSINTKLFALISLFVLVTLVYGGYQNHRTMSQSLYAQLDSSQKAELLSTWKLVHLHLESLKARASDALFSSVPAGQKVLRARMKTLLQRFPEMVHVEVDWQGATQAHSQKKQHSVLARLRPALRPLKGQSLVAFGDSTLVFQEFALSRQGSSFQAQVRLLTQGTALRSLLKSTEEQKLFLVATDPVKHWQKKGKSPLVLSQTGGLAELLQSEIEVSQLLRENSGNHTEILKPKQGAATERELAYYTKSFEESGLRLGLRADFRTALQSLSWSSRVSLWTALVILSLAMLLSYLSSLSFNKRLQQLIAATSRIARGDLAHQLQRLPQSEVGILGNAINSMTVQLNYYLRSQVDSVRKEQELLTAKAVEERFFVSERVKSNSRLKVKGTHRSASECAGDWWCHFQLSESQDLVVISDAPGHGAGAALVVAIAYSFFKTHINNVQLGIEKPCRPAELASRLNEIFCQTSQGSSTMTMQIWLFDSQAQEATFVNCGHNSSFVLLELPPAGGDNKPELKIKTATNASDLLGMYEGAKYREEVYPYERLRRVFLYTDGLVECRGRNGKNLRVKQVKKVLEEKKSRDFKSAALEIVGWVGKHFSGVELADDITLVFVDMSHQVAGSPVRHSQKPQSLPTRAMPPPPPSPQELGADPESESVASHKPEFEELGKGGDTQTSAPQSEVPDAS